MVFVYGDMIKVIKQENYSYEFSNKCHLWIKYIFAILIGEKSYYENREVIELSTYLSILGSQSTA